MRAFGLALLLSATFFELLAQQPASPPSAPADPQIAWEFNSGG